MYVDEGAWILIRIARAADGGFRVTRGNVSTECVGRLWAGSDAQEVRAESGQSLRVPDELIR